MATLMPSHQARDFVVSRLPLAPFSGAPAVKENGNVCTETRESGHAEGGLLESHDSLRERNVRKLRVLLPGEGLTHDLVP